MPEPGLVRVWCQLDAASLPAAMAALEAKMGGLCPGMSYDIESLSVVPKPGGSPPPIVGPPWRFSFAVLVTATFP